MLKATVYNDVWIRWLHASWLTKDGWRTDIHQSVLDEMSIKTALFILDDRSTVFVPMDDMRKILLNAPRSQRHGGKVVGPYNVNPHSRTVDGIPVDMRVLRPKDRKTDLSEYY